MYLNISCLYIKKLKTFDVYKKQHIFDSTIKQTTMNASQKTAETYFDHIGSITLPLDVVRNCSHSGPCDEDVKRSMELPEVKAELAEIDPIQLRKELSEYGAWDDDQLLNHDDNLERILWIAAGNIDDELREQSKKPTANVKQLPYEEVTPKHPDYLECVGAFPSEDFSVEKYFIHTLYPANHYGALQFILQTNGKYFTVIGKDDCETEDIEEILQFMANHDLNKPLND